MEPHHSWIHVLPSSILEPLKLQKKDRFPVLFRRLRGFSFFRDNRIFRRMTGQNKSVNLIFECCACSRLLFSGKARKGLMNHEK